jgi:hypothetical protein
LKVILSLLPFLACSLAGVAACSSGSSGSAGTCTQVPVYNASFASYESWTAFAFTGAAIPGSPHTSGPRRIYLNQKPPHGATEFPVGTIIVKEIGAPPASGDSVFAMVKVGCDYNSDGAVNWEWFELQVDATNAASILWSGSEPPPGQSYSGDPTACNDCHGDAKQNDYVESPELSLSNF